MLLIVAGVALFMYKPKSNTADNTSASIIGAGELLLALSLLCDGLTGKKGPKYVRILELWVQCLNTVVLIQFLGAKQIFFFGFEKTRKDNPCKKVSYPSNTKTKIF